MSQQRREFSNLSPDDKSGIWLNKISNVLQFSWNEDQLNSLNELRSKVSPSLYVKGSSENTTFQNQFLPIWAVKAKQQFSINELRNIVLNLNNYSPQGNPIVGLEINYPNAEIDCSCSSGSILDFCGFNSYCEKANCNSVAFCGFLWAETCDGICYDTTQGGGGAINPNIVQGIINAEDKEFITPLC